MKIVKGNNHLLNALAKQLKENGFELDNSFYAGEPHLNIDNNTIHYGGNYTQKESSITIGAQDPSHELPEDWDELAQLTPVPAVQAGQYWEWVDNDASPMFRIQAVHSETERARIKYLNDVEKDWYLNDIIGGATLLSDEQVEQALTREAERRGFEVETKCNNSNLIGRSVQDFTVPKDRELMYQSDLDRLVFCKGHANYEIYKKGNWAEIITDAWEVEPAGWQKCPICEGRKKFVSYEDTGGKHYKACDTCNGQGIINKATGNPPIK